MGYPKRAHPEVCVPPSRRLGVMPESARRYVSGEQDLRAWQIIEVCNYFGVSADFLLGLKDRD